MRKTKENKNDMIDSVKESDAAKKKGVKTWMLKVPKQKKKNGGKNE